MLEEKSLVQQIEELLPEAFGAEPKMQYHELFKCLGQNFYDKYSFDEAQKAVAELIGRGVLMRPEVDFIEFYSGD